MRGFLPGMSIAFALAAVADGDVELGLIPRPQVEHREPEPDAGAILGTAIEQAAANRPRKIVVFTQVGCGPCNRMHNEDVPGDDLDLEFRQEQPVWLESFPAIWLPDVNRVAYGYHSHADLRAVLARNPVAPKAVQAMTLGKLAIRKPVRDLLSLVIVSGGQTEIRFGSAAIILPSEMQHVVSWPLKGIAITFTGKRPRLRYGSGFLSLGADINSVVLTETQLVLGVAGVPDVALEITE